MGFVEVMVNVCKVVLIGNVKNRWFYCICSLFGCEFYFCLCLGIKINYIYMCVWWLKKEEIYLGFCCFFKKVLKINYIMKEVWKKEKIVC